MEEFKYKVKFIAKKELAKDTWSFDFAKPEGFNFIPGQFMKFYIPGYEEEVMRSYSIESIPSDLYLKFVIKLIEGGKGSQYLQKIKVGDELKMCEADGYFTINPEAKSHFFVATGTGLIPVISMIREELETKKTNKKIHLLFGVRYKENIFGLNKLSKLAEKYFNFSYGLTLSQSEETWSGLKGRVTEHIPQKIDDNDFYLCGSAPMVMQVRKMLFDQGVEPEKIHFEIY